MNDLVFMQDGQALTDSLIIADHYGKEHFNVMAAVRGVIDDLPELEGELTFQLASYVDAQNKERPFYRMNRDGAILLTNTFKGRKARQKQWQFIQLFNAMEKHIKEGEPSPVQTVATQTAKALELVTERLEALEAKIDLERTPSAGPDKVSSADLWKRWRPSMRLGRYKHPRLHGAITAMMIADGVKRSRDWSARPVCIFDEKEADTWFHEKGRKRIRAFIKRMDKRPFKKAGVPTRQDVLPFHTRSST